MSMQFGLPTGKTMSYSCTTGTHHNYIYSYANQHLILLAGDVETNPGPEKTCPCEEKTDEKTIRCEKCETIWHENCIGLKGSTPKAMEKVSIIHCLLCIQIPKVKEKIAETVVNIPGGNIMECLKKMEDNLSGEIKRLNNKVNSLNDQVNNSATNTEKNKYNEIAAMTDMGSELKKVTKSVQRLNNHNPSLVKEKEDKDQRTYIVVQYKDKKIISSADIKREMNINYPGVAYRDARTTAGGSIKIEFDDVKAGEEVQKNWKKSLFGGNEGIKNVISIRSAGIIKDVFLDEREEDIEEEILTKYPDAKCEFFKKQNRFTGTIKITFKDEKALQNAIESRINIFNQKYVIEVFKMKPRVIKCNRCQKLGHVSRVCRAPSPKCGKCGNSHETTTCTVPSENYKCYHCAENHETGNSECEVMKQKLDEIKKRRQDD